MKAKLKLDENLGRRGQQRLREAGHDVHTVVDEALTSATDERVAEACRTEGRALVTLDLDFANPLRFPPHQHAGIVVLRLPARAAPDDLDAAVERLVAALTVSGVAGELWIIEPDRLRTYTGGSE